jgi:hypothetical protein
MAVTGIGSSPSLPHAYQMLMIGHVRVQAFVDGRCDSEDIRVASLGAELEAARSAEMQACKEAAKLRLQVAELSVITQIAPGLLHAHLNGAHPHIPDGYEEQGVGTLSNCGSDAL